MVSHMTSSSHILHETLRLVSLVMTSRTLVASCVLIHVLYDVSTATANNKSSISIAPLTTMPTTLDLPKSTTATDTANPGEKVNLDVVWRSNADDGRTKRREKTWEEGNRKEGLGKKKKKTLNFSSQPRELKSTGSPHFGASLTSPTSSASLSASSSSSSSAAAVVKGQFVLGGLFPVHKKGQMSSCGEIQPDRGIQRVEAMLFTIDHINRNKNLLRDVSLGANILDTCSRDTYALDQALDYVRASLNVFDSAQFECRDKSKPRLLHQPDNVVGVVGGSYSSVSIVVANLLRLFKIPQVSYASTSAALSDKTRFELFARTVPSDNYQAKAMVDIAEFFNWTYVSTVASEGEYGEMGIDAFRKEARARNICIAISEKISQSATPESLDEIIESLLTKRTAPVVVLFLRVEDARDLLQAARRKNEIGHFVWLASDGWGKEEMPVRDNDVIADGALTIELQSTVLKEFDTYFKQLSPRLNTRNPWFREYWEHVHGCKLSNGVIRRGRDVTGDNVTDVIGRGRDVAENNATVANAAVVNTTSSSSSRILCNGREMITSKIYSQESKIQFVYDAVYAFAHALDRLIDDSCGDPVTDGRVLSEAMSKNSSDNVTSSRDNKSRRTRCINALRVDGDSLYKNYLLNVSFDDGYGAWVKFNRQGDGLGRYNVMNYRRNRRTRKYEYVTIGHWTDAGLTMYRGSAAGEEAVGREGVGGVSGWDVRWPGGTDVVPRSLCSEQCQGGEIKRVQPGDVCCWVCTSCDPADILIDEYSCRACPFGWWPSPDKKRCIHLVEQYMRLDTAFALVPALISTLGIISTLVIIITFISYIDTPVVKASGRELSFMLLGGFLLCYAMTFVILAKPSAVVCAVQRFGVGFSFSVTYSSLLVKTNRISRIFDSARRSAQRPVLISPRSQVLLSLLLISVQVIGAVVWLAFEPPNVRLYHPNGRRNEIVLRCGFGDLWFMLSLGYNMILILVCTIYAIKTRKIPENFNESKYIGFTMYTTCVIWLSFVPIYFGTYNSFQVQLSTLCISISLSATVALLCLFMPKLRIIAFQSDKNVRKPINSAIHKKSTSSCLSAEFSRQGAVLPGVSASELGRQAPALTHNSAYSLDRGLPHCFTHESSIGFESDHLTIVRQRSQPCGPIRSESSGVEAELIESLVESPIHSTRLVQQRRISCSPDHSAQLLPMDSEMTPSSPRERVFMDEKIDVDTNWQERMMDCNPVAKNLDCDSLTDDQDIVIFV